MYACLKVCKIRSERNNNNLLMWICITGTPGQDGKNGLNGNDGKNGKDGAPGLAGKLKMVMNKIANLYFAWKI